jgi:hypothetical protein
MPKNLRFDGSKNSALLLIEKRAKQLKTFFYNIFPVVSGGVKML